MKDQYAWVPWFRQLVEKITEGSEKDLVDRAKRVHWKGESPKNPDVKPALLNYGDENIDPFSFLYFLASCNTINKNRPIQKSRLYCIYKSVSEEFELDYTLLLSDESTKHGCVFPVPWTNFLFHSDGKGNPTLLWKVFRRIAGGDVEITQQEFKDILSTDRVGVQKLTQCLFLIDPQNFMPADETTLRFHDGLGLSSFEQVRSEIDGPNGWLVYKYLLTKFRSALPGCELYEINTVLYKIGLWKDKKDPTLANKDTALCKNFFQVSTRVYGKNDVDHWDGENVERQRGRTFSTANCVYTGGKAPRTEFSSDKIIKRPYPLTAPSTGDIILVRYGLRLGHAIGIVYFNEYADKGLTEESAIHVLWLNKKPTKLKLPRLRGFSFAYNPTYRVFYNANEYRQTCQFIKHINQKTLPSLPPSPPDNKPMQHNQILYGPPGTGKTWHTTNHALDIIDGEAVNDKERFDELKQDGQIAMVTFHQSFTYEDFVEGIRPVFDDDALKYEIVDGVFKRISEQAEHDPDQRYVLIIDEINRGNIAKIFGELITLIELTKRLGNSDEATVTLPYSGDQFGIPQNLYLIGTMNTADRAIALLDMALRRRFDFIEMMPDLNLVSENVGNVNCRRLLESMNQRITALLDRDHQLGHSYFMDISNIDSLARVFKTQIIPLLQEYFYDDWENVYLVLNRNNFVTVEDFPKELLMEKNRKIHKLIPSDNPKWNQPENYQHIYSSTPSKQPGKDGE